MPRRDRRERRARRADKGRPAPAKAEATPRSCVSPPAPLIALSPDDLPSRPGGDAADESFARLDARSVHRIDVVLPRPGVTPQDVGLAVAVVVASGDDLPAQV